LWEKDRSRDVGATCIGVTAGVPDDSSLEVGAMLSLGGIRARFLMVASLAVLLALWLLGREHTDGGRPKSRSPQRSSAPALQAAHGDAGGKEAKVRLQRMDRMLLSFIENRGQLDSRVVFYLQGRDKTLYFTERP
jgi:hypothetical protein